MSLASFQRSLPWAVSLLLHGGLGAILLLLPAQPKHAVPLDPMELTDRTLPEKPRPPEPKIPEVEKEQPKKVAMLKKVPRATPRPPKPAQPAPQVEPDKPTEPDQPPAPPSFGIKMSGTASASTGTGVQVPQGDTLLANPGAPRPKKKEKKKRTGFKAQYQPGEKAPVAVITRMPKLMQRVEPVYPERMKELGIEGRVVLELLIDGKGRVIKVTVVQSLHPELDKAAVAAARKLRFTPATHNGTPVSVTIPLTFGFVLD